MSLTDKEKAAKFKKYRINASEFEMMCEQLGREPRGVEWAVYSALWSEHCSYKSSRVHLKKFFSKSERVVQGFGENAGVIDLGEGEKVAFKMESHNHPSYIEPYQGAATGVGGILRDIFTMGARPIALANYLCFGQPKADRMSELVDGVVKGIGGYGNCVGVPTITGHTEFHSSYDENILVNALAVGLYSKGEEVFTAPAKGPGNSVVYVGAKTGRDGVHGASMASESFDENSASQRPTVQIGDPFFEKLLIESCIEVMQQGLVESIQDMGAAGLTSSSFEMAASGGVGLKLELDKVPLRQSDLEPEDILLSESQERMLLICKPEKFEALQKVFHKWGLDAAVVGTVTEAESIDLYWHNEMIASLDPQKIVEGAPRYERPYKPWQELHRGTREQIEASLSVISNVQELKNSTESIHGTTREWIYNQYDQRVGAKTARDCSQQVAAQRLPSGRALGLVLGCRPHIMRFDASEGAKDAVIYPALQLATKGMEALAATDCLNFGNPEKPDLMSEFVASVESMSAACEALKVPVISGNVSFYNETKDKNVTSTPSTGLVGLGDSLDDMPRSEFTQLGQKVFVVTDEQLILNGRLAEVKGVDAIGEGRIDPARGAQFVTSVRDLVNATKSTGLAATRTVGQFGLAYTLMRMCDTKLGFELDDSYAKAHSVADMHIEKMYQVVCVVDSARAEAFKQQAKSLGLECEDCATVTEGELTINSEALKTNDLSALYKQGWSTHFADLT